jgi:hypothetical protein
MGVSDPSCFFPVPWLLDSAADDEPKRRGDEDYYLMYENQYK